MGGPEGDPGFFLGGGAPLRNGVTYCRITVRLESRMSPQEGGGEGGGVCTLRFQKIIIYKSINLRLCNSLFASKRIIVIIIMIMIMVMIIKWHS